MFLAIAVDNLANAQELTKVRSSCSFFFSCWCEESEEGGWGALPVTVLAPELRPPCPLAQPALERGQVKLEVVALPPGGYTGWSPETQTRITGPSHLGCDLENCLNLLVS